MTKQKKVLKLTIESYDGVEMYIEFDADKFDEACDIISDCADEWLLNDDLQNEYGDICDYYEEKLDEAGIEYRYINTDDELVIL